MEVKLRIVGCSPAWPNPGGAQSGYLVEDAGRRLLLDCGPGVLARLREWEDWPRVDAIAITHWHLDHWGDLVPWVWAAHVRPGKRDSLRPSSGCRRVAATSCPSSVDGSGSREMFEQAFELHEYEPGTPFEAAGFEVTPVKVLHYDLEAYGFRASANGTVLAYSGDSGPNGGLAELARDADLFVCEATLADGSRGARGTAAGPSLGARGGERLGRRGREAAAAHAPPAERASRRALRAGQRRARARALARFAAIPASSRSRRPGSRARCPRPRARRRTSRPS